MKQLSMNLTKHVCVWEKTLMKDNSEARIGIQIHGEEDLGL